MSAELLNAAQDAETKIRAEQRDVVEAENARNDLESYVYNMRDRCSEGGQYGNFISPAVRDTFQSDLLKAEDWLYDNEGATKVVYVDKLQELQTVGSPVVARYKAKEDRAELIADVLATISHYRTLATSEDEKYAHIAAEKKQQIIDECATVEGWLTAKVAEQEKLPEFENSILLPADMAAKKLDVSQLADKILSEPKPAPPPPPKEEKDEVKEEKAQDTKAEEKPVDAAAEEAAEASLDVD